MCSLCIFLGEIDAASSEYLDSFSLRFLLFLLPRSLRSFFLFNTGVFYGVSLASCTFPRFISFRQIP